MIDKRHEDAANAWNAFDAASVTPSEQGNAKANNSTVVTRYRADT